MAGEGAKLGWKRGRACRSAGAGRSELAGVSSMSRSITISYRDAVTEAETTIEVEPPYFLLGGQRSSMAFWAIPRIREVGIERLALLGDGDPIYFFGWEEMGLLDREITLLGRHLASIDYLVEVKASWLCHLIYCYHLLMEKAPKESVPIFGIG